MEKKLVGNLRKDCNFQTVWAQLVGNSFELFPQLQVGHIFGLVKDLTA